MKLVTYSSGSGPRLGVQDGERVFDLQQAGEAAGKRLPSEMRAFIRLGEAGLDDAEAALKSGAGAVAGSVELLAPLQDLRKNVFCVGRNYMKHIEEGFRARGVPVRMPEYLELFSKPPTTVIGRSSCSVVGECPDTAAASTSMLKVVFEGRSSITAVIFIGRTPSSASVSPSGSGRPKYFSASLRVSTNVSGCASAPSSAGTS